MSTHDPVNTGDVASTSAIDRARAIVSDPAFDVPLPGRGDTETRFRRLAGITRTDIAVGRMVEAHLDALAILSEIGERDGGRYEAGRDELWGVWAAEPPAPVVMATETSGGWTLSGTKPWCSGASGCTSALVTARVGDERRLFAVDLRQRSVHRARSEWHHVGMSGTSTAAVEFVDTPARPVGDAGVYLDRAGFWHGGIGVAACWFGGAAKVAQPLYDKAKGDSDHRAVTDDLTLMHLGAVDGLLAAGWAQLRQAATDIDSDPDDLVAARHRAFAVRWSIEQVATAVTDRVGRALGPQPLVRDADHAQAVSDLSVYVRQSHADRDLVDLGRLVVDGGSGWMTDTGSTYAVPRVRPAPIVGAL